MALLQNKLNLRVSQKQILTPGLVQMVSVLALNKLELKDMITAEIVENPVLEELEESSISLEEIARKEEHVERTEVADEQVTQGDKNDPFDEIDFGSFFRDYLDPGHRTHSDIESLERPSFENFLSRPTTLTDHLMWQLGSLSVSKHVREAAERIIGNLNEDGYLVASDDELQGLVALLDPEKVVPKKPKRKPYGQEDSEDAEVDALAPADEFARIADSEEDAEGLDPELTPEEDFSEASHSSGVAALHLVSRNDSVEPNSSVVVHQLEPQVPRTQP